MSFLRRVHIVVYGRPLQCIQISSMPVFTYLGTNNKKKSMFEPLSQPFLSSVFLIDMLNSRLKIMYQLLSHQLWFLSKLLDVLDYREVVLSELRRLQNELSVICGSFHQMKTYLHFVRQLLYKIPAERRNTATYKVTSRKNSVCCFPLFV